jgi:enoyl-CoA hydratase/carnithine racemase
MWLELQRVLDEIDRDDKVRVVVLTGAGGVFSAGGDLKSTPAMGSGLMAPAARLKLAQDVVGVLYSLSKPTICAVEGYAVGAGMSLVLACDLVVSANDAFFQTPFTGRGLVPDVGAAWQLLRRLGHHRAAEMIMLGERWSAAKAAEVGLVNRVVEHGEALSEAVTLADILVGGSADALALAKGLLRNGADMAFENFLRMEYSVATLALAGPDAIKGRDAFTERRPPHFRSPTGGEHS